MPTYYVWEADVAGGQWVSTSSAGVGSPLTTKGDLYGFSTTNDRVPVGTDGQVLTADSTQALGVKWDTGASAGVSSLDSITGAVSLVAGSNVTITDNSPSAGDITIASTGGGASQLDYAQQTSNTTITGTTDATANTIVTGNAVTYSGSQRVLIEWFGGAQIGVTNEVVMVLYDGATDLGRVSFAGNRGSGTTDFWIPFATFLTPSSGSHTFSIRAWKTSGTSTCLVYGGSGGAGVPFPNWYRITAA